MEGVFLARYQGPALEAKPVDPQAPIVLRIEDATADGASTIYDLRFIGVLPGRYDLRDYLQRVDGRPITGLEEINVAVAGTLPDDHDGSIAALADPPLPQSWPVRTLLIAAAVLWCVPAAIYLARRAARLFRRRSFKPGAAPTLADQLRPLVEAAVENRLSPEEQSRLELLLISHWRERLDLTGCSAAETLQKLRKHDEAGVLLRELDRWLHQRPGGEPADVAAVLRPYLDQSPVRLAASF